MSFHAEFAAALFAHRHPRASHRHPRASHRHPRAGGDPECSANAPLHAVFTHPAFAVYRNTVMKGCIDALEANFPAVARLVGRDWFRSAAAEYVRMRPPRDARLLAHGDEGFGAFLQSLPSASTLPWLAEVARADALWRAAHVAADAPVLDASALADDAAEVLAARVLRPHPAARWAWFDDAPVASLWSRHRDPAVQDSELAWQGEGLLLTRPGLAVQWQPLSRAGCVLLDVCAQSEPLGVAAERALEVEAQVDLASLLAQVLRAGGFTEGEPT